MRLDDVDTSDVEVEDQRGQGGGFGFPMGGGGMPLSGRMGCGTLIILIIAALFFNVDIGSMMGGGTPAGQSPQTQTQAAQGAGQGCT